MKIKVRICFHKTQGLFNDAYVLTSAIKNSPNFLVETFSYNEMEIYQKKNFNLQQVDVQFFLEHIFPEICPHAKKNIFIPNIEFLNLYDVKNIQLMNYIFAKTLYSFDVIKKNFWNIKSFFSGWSSVDRKINSDLKKNYNTFLHVKGTSRFKNSQFLINTWLKHQEWPKLKILLHGSLEQNGYLEINSKELAVSSNVFIVQRKLDEEELNLYFNTYGLHICCSEQEGFGHYINEARSTESLVITTDGYPMKELVNEKNGILVGVDKEDIRNKNYGVSYSLKEKKFVEAIDKVLTLNIEQRELKGKESRKMYIQDDQNFKNKITCFFKEEFLSIT